MKFVMMAGGQGTKLWPLSRDDNPKQFNKIIDTKSLFQKNLEDLLSAYEPKDIYISTSEGYEKYIVEQAQIIPKQNILLEPHLKRNTGPASCYSMVHMLRKHPNEVIAFYVQPVVVRKPREKYIEMLQGMEKLVKQHKKLITGGMVPKHPEVGSDYILLGKKIAEITNLEVYDNNQYVERPGTVNEAKNMIESMNVVVHCNHYAWTPKEFFESLKVHHKNWYDVSMEIFDLLEQNASYEKIKDVYSKYEPGKVEFFTKKVYDDVGVQVVILPFEWIHITTWKDVYEYLKNNGASSLQGKIVEVDSSGNVVINKSDELVTLLGVEDHVVVKTDDTIFICPVDKSGMLNKLLSNIEEEGFEEVL